MNTTITSEAKQESLIAALSKDWLNRDGDSFVHIRKTGRLGWESSLAKGAPYSSYILESPTQQELIEKAYSLAKNTISAMNTPFKVTVKLRNSHSCTDGRCIYVATDFFDDEIISVGDKLDIFLGLTVHEGSHLLYTDFTQMQMASQVHPICANLLNIIEDERIERILGEEKPGLANYLKAVKEHYFGKYAEDVKETEPEELTTIQTIINCILGLIRYPRLLKESEMIKYGELLLEVKDILTPYPETTSEAEAAAERIFELIKAEYAEKEKKTRKKGKKESGMDTDSSDEKCQTDKALKHMNKDCEKISKSLDNVAGGPVQPDVDGCSGFNVSNISECILKDKKILADICEGIVEIGSSNDILFLREPENREKYNSSLTDVRQYIPAIRNVIKGHCKDYKLTHMGMRSGILDTNKLAEAYQGAPTVYLRHGEVKSDKACVCILVDESGSMIREGRMSAARSTAILINEALKGIDNIELFIYGHSADETVPGKTDLRIYREKDYAPIYSLGSLQARDNNRDGVAILETARRVRKQTDEEVLMFVLSDGVPAASDYIGHEAIKHTKECVEQAEKMGFRIVQICINGSYDPALMFKHYIKLEDMSCLARDLGKEVSKALSAKIKNRII